jgi:hypothetical protein
MLNNWSFHSSHSGYSSLYCITTTGSLIEDYYEYTLYETTDYENWSDGGSADNLYRVLSSSMIDVASLHLIIRKHPLSEHDLLTLNQVCKVFGPDLRMLKVWSAYTRLVDFLSFPSLSNLRILDLIHDHNVSLSRDSVMSIANCCTRLEECRLKVEGSALSSIKNMTHLLRKLNLFIEIPYWMTQEELDAWSAVNVNVPLIEGLRDTSFQLMSLSVKAPRVKLPYELMNLSAVQYLDIDVGLFGQIQRLCCAKSLKYLTYSYYGKNFLIHPEMDNIHNLLDKIPVNVDSLTLKVDYEFENRNEMIDNLAAVAEEFGFTTFYVTAYYDHETDEVLESDAEDEMDVEDARALGEKVRLEKSEQELRKSVDGSTDSGVDSMKDNLIEEKKTDGFIPQEIKEEEEVIKENDKSKEIQIESNQESDNSIKSEVQLRVMRMDNMIIHIQDTEKDQKHFAKYIFGGNNTANDRKVVYIRAN